MVTVFVETESLREYGDASSAKATNSNGMHNEYSKPL